MIKIAGAADRLRPHVKTHKIAEIIQMHAEQGITKFKCATLIELEMTARSGGKDMLLAYPLLGPDIQVFMDIVKRYTDLHFAVTVDSFDACADLTRAAIQNHCKVDVFVDIDNGMHRTGADTEAAFDLCCKIQASDFLNLRGLHIYDGHIHTSEPDARESAVQKDFRIVDELLNKLKAANVKIGELACGGTFSFPVHARHSDRTMCPGTPVLWDAGYEQNIPDLNFLQAAVLVGRVISKPGSNTCLDLGHKAVAAEMSQDPIKFLDYQECSIEGHSEEHLVIQGNGTEQMQVGQLIYTVPRHICPTVALHEKVYIVNQGYVEDIWNVAGRRRIY